MSDKGGAFNKQGQNMQRQQGKFNKHGQNQQDQQGEQNHKGQRNWPSEESKQDKAPVRGAVGRKKKGSARPRPD